MAGIEDPQWPRASAWLSSGTRRPGAPLLAVLGAPLSQASISPSGAHHTPAALRAALRRFSTFCALPEGGVDLTDVDAVDLGDLDLAGMPNEEAQQAVAEAVARVQADLLVLLGGDNSITRPAVRARMARLDRAGVLTLDAHHDVRGFHAGPTNGTPIRGLIADGLPGTNVVQIGIGEFTNSRAYRTWADERGITTITATEARAAGVEACVRAHLDRLAERCDAVWVDLDVDVLDSAFAPGCPGARPGGLAPWELHAAARAAGMHPAVSGLDIVEVDATIPGPTVDTAALCLLSAAAGLALR